MRTGIYKRPYRQVFSDGEHIPIDMENNILSWTRTNHSSSDLPCSRSLFVSRARRGRPSTDHVAELLPARVVCEQSLYSPLVRQRIAS